MLVLPWLWYRNADALCAALDVGQDRLALVLVLGVCALEAVRLALGITIFGQREYEARQVSALAWGAVSIAVVFWLAPRRGLEGSAWGAPIVATLAVVDPLLGELRRAGRSTFVVAAAGVVAASLLWAGAALWLGTPWAAVAWLPALTVAAEWPRLRWIDDNATMTLVPLAVVLLLDARLAG